MQLIPISSITIRERQRKEFKSEDLESLADSIRRLGLIHPIIIDEEYNLVAGERRLRATRDILGEAEISVSFTEEVDPLTLYLIELEENTRRADLTWQEHNDAIEAYHSLRAEQEGKSWSQAKTAEALGLSRASVTNHLNVAKARKSDPSIDEIQKYSTALNSVNRKLERSRAAVTQDLASTEISVDTSSAKPKVQETKAIKKPARSSVHNVSFLAWGPRASAHYNLVHCDFPYGVGATKIGQSSAEHAGRYSDLPEDYFRLLNCLVTHQDRFIAPSAHLIFWYSLNFHSETVKILSEAGWAVNPFPLIWFRNDNKGIIPDANRGPRRVYETALLASRGDRKIVKPVSNLVASPTTKEYHSAEKPRLVLEHFFRMLVDESTHLLDPTCGGGNALRVAEAMGAASAFGLEMDEEFADLAQQNLLMGRAKKD